jgi:hypothetical protein
VSLNVTFTVVTLTFVLDDEVGILTPSSNEFAPVAVELEVLAHPATPPRIPINAIPVKIRRRRDVMGRLLLAPRREREWRFRVLTNRVTAVVS